ncbi:hypothetical protein [Escherichia coli]|uniref:hypothetical protein n=1 Tax=Escherichia coli TaxID=562 RepID=UPI001D159962|nr:hypothetical protein [Escherichia coli]
MSGEPYTFKVLISPALKEQFRQIVDSQDRALSQVLRDLMREYVWRTSKRRKLHSGRLYWRSSGEAIRAVIDPELKAQFEAAAQQNNVLPSRVLRDLIREYVERHTKGEIWEPGAEIKLKHMRQTQRSSR